MNHFIGLEVLHASVQDQLFSKDDCLIVAIHTLMINIDDLCVGIGDSWEENNTAYPTQLLPPGWNLDQGVYTLRYVSNSSGNRYLLKIIKAGPCLLINLFNVNEEKAAGMSVNVDNHVSDDYKAYPSAYRSLEDVASEFQSNIVQKIHTKAKTERRENKTEDRGSQHDPPAKIPSDRQNAGPSSLLSEPSRVPFPSVGRGDLDPMGGHYGGGMLFDPSSMGFPSRPSLPDFGVGGPGGLPRGAVPPGARFDPFGPPMRGRGPGGIPDPDHLPPPGYSDQFM